MSDRPAIKTTDIHMTRSIPATPEQVFDAWLDRTCPGSPWHGVPKVIVADSPSVGTLFYSAYHMEGRDIAHYGRFVTLERGRRIEHTWVSEGTKGLESLVTLTLEPEADGKTLVRVHHSGVPDDEGGRFHENAWGYVLGAMKTRFGAAKKGE
jgi:uncharacterized protein YndB with AHSA1/START domain